MPAKLQLDETAVIAAYSAKTPLSTICAEFGCSAPSIYGILTKHKIARHNKRTGAIPEQEFTKDYALLPMPVLVQKYELSRPSIREKAKKLGLARPKALLHKQTKVTVDEQLDICAAYRGGKSMQMLATSSNLSVGAVFSLLKQHGVEHTNLKFGKTEQELRGWLEATSGVTFSPNRSLLAGKEIDMYNEERQLGIEFCGLYWHTEDSPEPRGRSYHHAKMLGCRASGVRLITVFEDEWRDRRPQVQSFLQSCLGKNSTKLYGRNCVVQRIDAAQGKAFIDQWHIQGKTGHALHFAGLYHADELVAVMSFGRHPREASQLVLDRLCFKGGVSVAGGASKLFKFLTSSLGVQEIFSWSDNRWSEGKVYARLGFVKDAELPPDYSYVNFKTGARTSKQSQKKSNTGCPVGTTELEFANNNGLHRIWDCGKIRWKWSAA